MVGSAIRTTPRLLLLAVAMTVLVLAPNTDAPQARPPWPITPPRAEATCAGAWLPVGAAPTPGMVSSDLNGVSSLSPDDAWAVGVMQAALGSPTTYALIEHWDGRSWRAVPDAFGTGQGATLNAVAVFGDADAWAVGSIGGISLGGPSPGQATVIEHWDGHRWRAVRNVNPSTSFNVLNAISGSGPNDVWAVGGYTSDATGFYQALIEHWDGRRWFTVPAGVSTQAPSELHGVVAIGPHDAWAVGDGASMDYVDGVSVGSSAQTAMIEHWDGLTWEPVLGAPVRSDGWSPFAPQPPWGDGAVFAHTTLNAVDANGSNDIWAVGALATSPMKQALVAYHWDGTSWSSAVVLPGIFPLPSSLATVRVISPSDVWAGGTTAIYPPPPPLLIHWGGRAWHKVDALPVGGQLGSVGVGDMAPDLWVVGEHAASRGGPSWPALGRYVCGATEASSWATVLTPPQAPTVDVTAAGLIDAFDGWALTSRGLLLSRDSGATWSDITPAGLAPSTVTAISFRDEVHGWVVGAQPGRLVTYRTDDGGQTWLGSTASVQSMKQAIPFTPGALAISDPLHAWLNLGAGGLYRTADGGASWNVAASPGAGPVDLTSPTVGFLVSGGVLYRSGDAGATWRRDVPRAPDGYPALVPVQTFPVFADAVHGAIDVAFTNGVATVRALYESSDGGQTWRLYLALGLACPTCSYYPSWVFNVGMPSFSTPDGISLYTSSAQGTVPTRWAQSTAPQLVTPSFGWRLTPRSSSGTDILEVTSDGGGHWSQLSPLAGPPP